MTFKEKCRKAGVNYHSAYTYRASHPELTEDEVFAHYRNKEATLKELCKRAGYSEQDYRRIKRYKDNHKIKSASDTLKQYKASLVKVTFKQKCEDVGVNYHSARYYKYVHPDWSDDRVISLALQKRDSITFNEKCRKRGIKLSAARSFKQKHLDWTDEEILDYYINKSSISFKDLCTDYDIDFDNAYAIKSKYKISNAEVIVYYRPELQINLFGEII